MSLHRAVLLMLCATTSSAVRILSGHALNCTRQDLRCEASYNNCMDPKWLDVNDYTPSAPEELQVSVNIMSDDRGQLQPVLHASWKIKDDGGISHLKATELHVLVRSTNNNVCVRYSFKDVLPMRRLSGEKWSFSSNSLVLDPGQTYKVSISNIPKPEMGHSEYDISTLVQVPDCRDPQMQMTQFCRETGSLWQPNISLTSVTTRDTLMVSFMPDSLCDQYLVIVKCDLYPHDTRVFKNNQMTLNVTFSLNKWPKSCCQFDAEIKPLFPQCGNDCPRRRTTRNICFSGPPPEYAPERPYILVAVGMGIMCVILAALLYVLCRKRGKPEIPPPPPSGPLLPQQPPQVLVIYSQDHHLYRDVVLKLCAFLQAKCGTKVLVDLLDSTSVGMAGRIRWLEWQRQQLKNPSDKILVLCSRGVQAKWRAMCGEGKVMLREDILSPTDDILIPFLNLFLPELHQAGMLGRYMVAYFQDISSEKDVPSVFDIGVKYNLMKNFEELYFRILDIEKYQPGRINQIQGIGEDEYFNCPSGRDLRNAIQTFQAYQLQHPDWFEKECVLSEEEVLAEASQDVPTLHVPPVLQCEPLIRDGPPVYVHDVHIGRNDGSLHILTPELMPEQQLSSLSELLPVLNPESSQVRVVMDHLLHPPGFSPESVYVAKPILNNQTAFREEPQGPTEDDEEDSLLRVIQPSAQVVLQGPLDWSLTEPSGPATQNEYFPSPEVSLSQPVEMDEEDLQPGGTGQISESDQGYISTMSSQQRDPVTEDPMEALARWQELLFQRNHKYSSISLEEE
ncbi:interleukin 17 receptor A1a isoform X2 [Melanotaenia boesemani]|uniref:interleukin 17 receptor A1a isoform X2 n=1 Tax=Melanotaenia boesemani TaxID=1250792 RepID=UPI001C03A716|nr:interleukin 17 receptor A1a isoform X2 [Melanotaenia boesemani]